MKQQPTTCKTCAIHDKSVFCDLSAKHFNEIDGAKTSNVYEPHQVIFYEGNQPYGLYCVSSGKVKVYKTGIDGHQQIVRIASPGDLLGYRCLLADEPYAASAETIEKAKICFIDKKTFLHIMETHPTTAMHVMRILSQDLRYAETQMLNFSHKNVRERLAELLLIFRARYGREIKQGVHLDISLSREELAELIGTTQESVIRLISEFKQENYILVNGREITLVNIPALIKTANISD